MSSTLAGAALAFPTIVPSSVLGSDAPSNRINLGLIGMGLQMSGHHQGALGRNDAQVLAVCDVDRTKRERARKKTETAYAGKTSLGSYKGCDAYNEYERILDRNDIDAVIIATPDHWHALIAVAAIRSGKDVYVEKPMTLTIREGRLLSDVARQHSAIVQVGSQQRSEGAFRKACEVVRNGWIGRVHTVYTKIGEFPTPHDLPEQPIPEGFDYDRWLGPTPWYPFNKTRVEGNYGGGWRCFWDYGARKNGDWGAHHFDIIQWALGMDNSGPVQFLPKGIDGAEYRSYLYAEGAKVWVNHPVKNDQMIQFIGDKGEVLVSRKNRLETTPATLKAQPLAPAETHLYSSSNHQSNWLECIRSRKAPICPAEIGHRTATICHLNAIAERLDRPIRWDPVNEEIVGDEYASRWTDRPRRAPYVV
jgi:predicted dehydrogenase